MSDNKIKEIQDGNHSTGLAFFNNWRTTRTASETQLIKARKELGLELIAQERLNREWEVAKTETKLAKEGIKREIELRTAAHTLQMAIFEAEEFITREAGKHGLDKINYQTLLVFEGNEKIRVASEIEIETAKSQLRMTEEREISRIKQLEEEKGSWRKVTEYAQFAEIDVEKDRRIKGNEIEAIVAVQLLGNEKMNQAQDHILNLIRKRDAIEQDRTLLPDSKREAIDIINESIRKAKEVFNYGEQRLLQINSGQELGGFDEDSDL